jgi:uncharacterized membrane protein
MLRKVRRTFLRGLSVLVPATVTVYVVIWLWKGAETLLGATIKQWVPETYYVPGMGLSAAVILILIVGLLGYIQFFRRLFFHLENFFAQLPLIKTLYAAVRDMLGLFQRSSSTGLSRVVMVTLGDTGAKVLGFVTREDFSDLPAGIGSEEVVAVYISMSYNLGGFTVMVPRTAIESVEMSVQDAMRFAITAGVRSRAPEVPAVAPKA